MALYLFPTSSDDLLYCCNMWISPLGINKVLSNTETTNWMIGWPWLVRLLELGNCQNPVRRQILNTQLSQTGTDCPSIVMAKWYVFSVRQAECRQCLNWSVHSTQPVAAFSGSEEQIVHNFVFTWFGVMLVVADIEVEVYLLAQIHMRWAPEKHRWDACSLDGLLDSGLVYLGLLSVDLYYIFFILSNKKFGDVAVLKYWVPQGSVLGSFILFFKIYYHRVF